MVAFLSSVLAGSTDPDRQRIAAAGRILERNEKLRLRIEAAKTKYVTRSGETRFLWKPEIERIDRVIVKNARGHAFFECGEPMLSKPHSVWCAPLERLTMRQWHHFENVDIESGWPEVGSRMMTRVLTGQDLTDGWVVVQNDVYRYSVVQEGVMRVRSVLFEYLATEVHWSE
jgi:hypothetical protein